MLVSPIFGQPTLAKGCRPIPVSGSIRVPSPIKDIYCASPFKANFMSCICRGLDAMSHILWVISPCHISSDSLGRYVLVWTSGKPIVSKNCSISLRFRNSNYQPPVNAASKSGNRSMGVRRTTTSATYAPCHDRRGQNRRCVLGRPWEEIRRPDVEHDQEHDEDYEKPHPPGVLLLSQDPLIPDPSLFLPFERQVDVLLKRQVHDSRRVGVAIPRKGTGRRVGKSSIGGHRRHIFDSLRRAYFRSLGQSGSGRGGHGVLFVDGFFLFR